MTIQTKYRFKGLPNLRATAKGDFWLIARNSHNRYYDPKKLNKKIVNGSVVIWCGERKSMKQLRELSYEKPDKIEIPDFDEMPF